MRGSAGVVVVAVAAVIFGLSACTGDDDPGPGPTTSVETSTSTPTPTPTPTPTALLPTLPVEATTQDAAGAQAFVRYWFDTLNYAYTSGSSDPLRSLSLTDCAECQDFYGLIEDLVARGERADGDALSVDALTSGPPDANRVLVILTYTELAVTLVSDDGDRRDLPQGNSIDAGAIAVWRDGAWSMAGIGSA